MGHKIIDAVSSKNVPSWGNKQEFIGIHYLGVTGQDHDISQDGCGAHYYIYHNGTIYQRCSHDAIVWAVGTAGCYTQKHPKARNSNTISIELCCKCDGDSRYAEDKYWYFTKATQEAAVWLVQKLMKELDIPAENVLRHFDIVSKTCPAPYVHNNKYRTSWTWEEFKQKISEEPEIKTDKIWMGWVKRETGKDGLRNIHGDNGKAYGLQFDYRYGLLDFLQFCLDYNSEKYDAFRKFISIGKGDEKLIYNQELGELWQKYYDEDTEEFEQLQYVCAYRNYYLPVKRKLKEWYGIDLDNHSPAVKGSAWSMSFRSGVESAAKKFSGCKDTDKDEKILNCAYLTYGTADGGRWTKGGQYGDALKALEDNTYTEVRTDMSLADILPETDKPWYRVRTSWADAGSQIGAYHDLQKAIDLADKMSSEKVIYSVFDESGKVLYTAKVKKQYIVQAGIFREKKNAEKLFRKIKKKGFAVCVKKVDGQYRVQCGVFEEKENADNMVKDLKAAGFNALIK